MLKFSDLFISQIKIAMIKNTTNLCRAGEMGLLFGIHLKSSLIIKYPNKAPTLDAKLS